MGASFGKKAGQNIGANIPKNIDVDINAPAADRFLDYVENATAWFTFDNIKVLANQCLFMHKWWSLHSVYSLAEIFDMLLDAVTLKFPVSKGAIGVILGTILYVVCPLDLIPDAIPILGWIDDTSVVSMNMSTLCYVMADYRKWKEANRQSIPAAVAVKN
jgi:uncharacterized membrane protein YkvA (DUF1232 family)